MKLCGYLIVVKDIQKARKYYHDLFGLEMLTDNDGNMILSGGLVYAVVYSTVNSVQSILQYSMTSVDFFMPSFS